MFRNGFNTLHHFECGVEVKSVDQAQSPAYTLGDRVLNRKALARPFFQVGTSEVKGRQPATGIFKQEIARGSIRIIKEKVKGIKARQIASEPFPRPAQLVCVRLSKVGLDLEVCR